jgi:hypothetical protein
MLLLRDHFRYALKPMAVLGRGVDAHPATSRSKHSLERAAHPWYPLS